jgi:hypothetical protein
MIGSLAGVAASQRVPEACKGKLLLMLNHKIAQWHCLLNKLTYMSV